MSRATKCYGEYMVHEDSKAKKFYDNLRGTNKPVKKETPVKKHKMKMLQQSWGKKVG